MGSWGFVSALGEGMLILQPAFLQTFAKKGGKGGGQAGREADRLGMWCE